MFWCPEHVFVPFICLHPPRLYMFEEITITPWLSWSFFLNFKFRVCKLFPFLFFYLFFVVLTSGFNRQAGAYFFIPIPPSRADVFWCPEHVFVPFICLHTSDVSTHPWVIHQDPVWRDNYYTVTGTVLLFEFQVPSLPLSCYCKLVTTRFTPITTSIMICLTLHIFFTSRPLSSLFSIHRTST